jgi:hypothetical protein
MPSTCPLHPKCLLVQQGAAQQPRAHCCTPLRGIVCVLLPFLRTPAWRLRGRGVLMPGAAHCGASIARWPRRLAHPGGSLPLAWDTGEGAPAAALPKWRRRPSRMGCRALTWPRHARGGGRSCPRVLLRGPTTGACSNWPSAGVGAGAAEPMTGVGWMVGESQAGRLNHPTAAADDRGTVWRVCTNTSGLVSQHPFSASSRQLLLCVWFSHLRSPVTPVATFLPCPATLAPSSAQLHTAF